ncbi:MAG: kelch repeat-containing protein [Candidatus Bathyarchaeia archaeon]
MSKTVMTTCILFVLLCISSLLPYVSATDDSWTSRRSMISKRSDFGVAVVDSKIFIIGGSRDGVRVNTTEVYDPKTDTWRSKASMPTTRSDFGIAVYDGKIYAFGGATCDGPAYGGVTLTDVNEVYDPETDTWENRTSLPTPRMSFNAHTVGDKIFTLSGVEYRAQFLIFGVGVTEVYDPQTDSWTTKARIPIPVWGYASAAVGNEIFVIGGVKSKPMGTNIAKLNQVYDLTTNSWSNKSAPIIGLYKSSAGATTGEFAHVKITVVGGLESLYVPYNDKTQVYDPTNDTWRWGTSMPTARARLGVAVVNDTLYALGGYDNRTYRTENEQYTPADYIPEFPSWIVLPLLVTGTVIALICKRKIDEHSV